MAVALVTGAPPPGEDMLADSMALQSGYGAGKLSNFSYFPGARFVIVGLLSRPDSYYKVRRGCAV